MAEPDTGELQTAENVPQGAGVSTMMTVAGAITSVALVAGLGAWAYQLAMRDVSGVPVVLALEGPMRVQPENPGGELALHQGLAVNNVQADGQAEPTADRLVLAPEEVGLISDDQPGFSPRPVWADGTDGTDGAVRAVADDVNSAEADEVTTETLPNAAPEVVAQLTASDVTDLDGSADADTPVKPLDVAALTQQLALGETEGLTEVGGRPAADATQTQNTTLAALDAPGLKRSLRPKARPARSAITPPTPPGLDAQGTETAGGVVDVELASLPLGTNMVQLGAFDSPEVAQEQWQRLAVKLGDFLDDKQRLIQKAKSGGKVFYRLRAVGFDDINDARRFCSALMAEGAACIPVVLR